MVQAEQFHLENMSFNEEVIYILLILMFKIISFWRVRISVTFKQKRGDCFFKRSFLLFK